VAISMVSARDGSAYALVLDAKTFQEVARTKFPYAMPYGLHCCWVPRNSNA
jgi:carlactone synthase/all-trans-10'-apo-beta-carotenal 13,14-cleaving dioxygenase